MQTIVGFLLVTLLACGTAHGQTKATSYDVAVDQSVVQVWVDPKSGCSYFITKVYKRYLSAPTIRYRADGKPDCPDVDKK